MALSLRSRRKSSSGSLNHTAIRAQIVSRCPATLAGLRDAALISVGYDTLCRSSELAAMKVEQLTFDGDGTAAVHIPRSKSDLTGKGRVAYLSPETTRLLNRWLAAAHLRAGPLFRGLHLNRPSHCALVTSSIRRLIKRATSRAGLDASLAAELSGHSMRIGAAQDMMVAGFDALAIMQAGGWEIVQRRAAVRGERGDPGVTTAAVECSHGRRETMSRTGQGPK